MSALVVPGVRVETIFDVLPPLPAPSGIVGVVGVVDRPPSTARLIGVSKVSELRDLGYTDQSSGGWRPVDDTNHAYYT